MAGKNGLIEIRWHGRGGQGAVTSAELVAQAAISEGKYAQAFPSFGPERRGAPVLAFVRIDSQRPIRIRAEITNPDVVVVLDPGLLSIVNVFRNEAWAKGLNQARWCGLQTACSWLPMMVGIWRRRSSVMTASGSGP